MIWEAVDNRAQKTKQRQKEYERKREEKRRNRQLYHLRHSKVRQRICMRMFAGHPCGVKTLCFTDTPS